MKTRAMNVRDPAYVSLPESEKQYIGRGGRGESGYFGNVHPVGIPCFQCACTHQRGEAVEAFKFTFEHRLSNDPGFRERVLALKGKALGCFCAPRSCHGDVIAAWVDAQIPD